MQRLEDHQTRKQSIRDIKSAKTPILLSKIQGQANHTNLQKQKNKNQTNKTQREGKKEKGKGKNREAANPQRGAAARSLSLGF